MDASEFNSRNSALPPDFLAEVYDHLPLLVARLTADGIVLSMNRAVTDLTGYGPEELVGKNWWGVMFPAKLFVQVPKFISAQGGHGLLRDHPMVLRTKSGGERMVAWTRFTRSGPGGAGEIVCLGIDLTDRLTLADVESAGPHLSVAGPETKTTLSAGEVDGSFVLPLAISPPVVSAGDSGLRAIQQVHEFLSEMDGRMAALESACAGAEIQRVAGLATEIRNRAHACGLLDLSVAADRLQQAAHAGALEAVVRQVGHLMEMCHRARGDGGRD